MAGNEHAAPVWVHNNYDAGIPKATADILVKRLAKDPNKDEVYAYLLSKKYEKTPGYDQVVADLKKNDKRVSTLQALRGADQIQRQYPDRAIAFEMDVPGGKAGDIDFAIMNKDGAIHNAIQYKTNSSGNMHKRLSKGKVDLKNLDSSIKKTIDMVVNDKSWTDFEKSSQYKTLTDRMNKPLEENDSLKGHTIIITFTDGVTKQW